MGIKSMGIKKEVKNYDIIRMRKPVNSIGKKVFFLYYNIFYIINQKTIGLTPGRNFFFFTLVDPSEIWAIHILFLYQKPNLSPFMILYSLSKIFIC